MLHCIAVGRVDVGPKPEPPPGRPIAGVTITYQADPEMSGGYILISHVSAPGVIIRKLGPGDDWQPPDAEDWALEEFLLAATPGTVGAAVFIAVWL